jgi:D-aspartate ligase
MSDAVDTSIPAVLLNCTTHGGLAAVRSLGRLGVSVYAIDGLRSTPGFFSRYTKTGFIWDINTESPDKSLRFLETVYNRIGARSVLLPTSDIAAVFVSNHAAHLSKWFIFPLQNPDLVTSLCNKKEMYHLAKKWNVATPETAFPQSIQDVAQYLESAQLPVLVKPVKSGPKAFKFQLAHSKYELLDLCKSIWDTSSTELLLQEYIPGDDSMTFVVNGYFNMQSDCLLAFSGRKLRNFLPYFGACCLGVCQYNEQVLRTTINFMKSIGYKGPLDLGYRFDVRDGRYKVLDINPRVGATFRLFVGDNGIDVVRATYLDMTRQQVVASPAREGRKWLAEDCDWFSALRYYRDGKLSFGDWRRSLQDVDEISYFAKDDLWPLAGLMTMQLRWAWNRGRKMLVRAVSRERTDSPTPFGRAA